MNLTFKDSFRNRSVFVTGHTGFKGAWLSLWLNRLGASVSGYALPPDSHPSNFLSSRVDELLVRSHNADIRDFSTLQSAMSACQPDVVLHLAAQALVRKSYLESRATFEVNVMGTANVLDAVRSLGRPCTVIIVTTDKCYENSDYQRIHSETDPLGGHDPYSASKAAAEIVAASYRRSFFAPNAEGARVKVASVRAGNVIGGGDWSADRIIPDAVKALSRGKPIQVRNPASIRPWQHVLEPLCGYLTLAARMLSSDDPALCSGWNFGPSPRDEATVEDLAETFCQAFGGGKWQSAGGKNQPAEAPMLRLSSTKAHDQLNWHPRWSFQETVERTARWYRSFYDRTSRSTRDLCMKDIVSYEAGVSAPSISPVAIAAQASNQPLNGSYEQ